jgi:hypothetical protein
MPAAASPPRVFLPRLARCHARPPPMVPFLFRQPSPASSALPSPEARTRHPPAPREPPPGYPPPARPHQTRRLRARSAAVMPREGDAGIAARHDRNARKAARGDAGKATTSAPPNPAHHQARRPPTPSSSPPPTCPHLTRQLHARSAAVMLYEGDAGIAVRQIRLLARDRKEGRAGRRRESRHLRAPTNPAHHQAHRPPTLSSSPPPSKLAPFHTRRQHSPRPLPRLNRLLLKGWTEVSPPTHPHSPQIHRFTAVLFISEVGRSCISQLDILHFY